MLQQCHHFFVALCSNFFITYAIIWAPTALAAPVFINELHYDNVGADIDEGVEIAGPVGTVLDGWRIDFYNGNNNSVYQSLSLTGFIDDLQAGFGVLSFMTSGIQNGGRMPDGVALIDDVGAVSHFISYEGSLVIDPLGSSEETTVFETSTTPIGFSLQLTGTGSESGDFNWILAEQSSFGGINVGQLFSAPTFSSSATEPLNPVPPEMEPLITDPLAISSPIEAVPVSEPAALVLLGVGLIGLGIARKHRVLAAV